MPQTSIEGQLHPDERRALHEAIVNAARKPEVVIEVGTWLGGGSTLHILRALEQNGTGHLWGVEADQSIYSRMIENIGAAAPECLPRFTPLFGFSDRVIPKLIEEKGPSFKIDLAFLDGGNSPREQISEFKLLDPLIPVGGQLFAHDARMRKGKWFVPYVSLLDNWESEVLDLSEMGLFRARKTKERPSEASRKAAEQKLLQLRLAPIEIVAAILPSWFCGFVLRSLPAQLSSKLAHGRR